MPENQSSPTGAARVRPLGDAALTIVFGPSIDAEIFARVKAFCSALEASAAPAAIEEWAPAFASVTIWYDPERMSYAALADFVMGLAQGPPPTEAPGPLFAIPFCCDADFAPDLSETARLKGLSADEYIDAFSALIFDVYMLGFQPGFAYLGALPHHLSAPRLDTPRKNVPARSVAIADGMCAAYPFASPGGWRLIGRTPAPLFDAENPARPALLAPGDRVRWRRIDRAAYDLLEASWSEGEFSAKKMLEADS